MLIIMPTYNSEHILHEVLESLKEKSIDKSQMEVLIVDGGSQDIRNCSYLQVCKNTY